MHPYRELIQSEMDRRGWKQADLARHSGLSRQTVSKIVNDGRGHLGQMPDDSTIDGIAKAFKIPADRIRRAAAASLSGYVEPVGTDPLAAYSDDFLLEELLRRRTEKDRKPLAD